MEGTEKAVPVQAARRAFSQDPPIDSTRSHLSAPAATRYGMTRLATQSPAAGNGPGRASRRTAFCLTRYYNAGAASEEFDGIPLSELPIDEVIWSEERAKHIRTRVGLKGPAEINIEPLWASEAALDPNRLVRRGSGRESVEVPGYSPSARRVLLVWIYTTEHPPSGVWQGGSAIVAGRRLRAAYWEGQGDDQED